MPQARVTFEHGHAKNRRVCHFKPARRGAMTGSAAAPASSSTKRLMTADRHVLRESSLALCNDLRGSVPRDERSAEAVVDARGDHVDILTDALAVIEHRAECLVIDHCDVASAHEQIIVFERERPVSRERIFAACSDHATPAGLAAAIRDESSYPSARTRWGRPPRPNG